MIHVINKSKCSGCGVCVEKCPKHCIEMKEDGMGFHYPSVNRNLCIDCGVCKLVCPFQGQLVLNTPLKAFAAWSKDKKLYEKSSSGGIATELARYIVSIGGVVYGCCADSILVKHIRVDKVEDLEKLQGSKYVQSNVQGVYAQVKQDLRNDRVVLFVGTPCQIASLKNYIGENSKKLYLVDIICHGVPSQKMLNEHVGKVLGNRKVSSLSFRKGNDFVLRIDSFNFSYQADLWKDRLHDMYYEGFIQGITYRTSCYSCPFAGIKRNSDITIGDFWGLGAKEPFDNVPSSGVSVILPLSQKGSQLIGLISGTLNIFERSVEEAIEGNSQLRHPVKYTWRAALFSKCYFFFSFDLSVRLSVLDLIIRTILSRIKKQIIK